MFNYYEPHETISQKTAGLQAGNLVIKSSFFFLKDLIQSVLEHILTRVIQ